MRVAVVLVFIAVIGASSAAFDKEACEKCKYDVCRLVDPSVLEDCLRVGCGSVCFDETTTTSSSSKVSVFDPNNYVRIDPNDLKTDKYAQESLAAWNNKNSNKYNYDFLYAAFAAPEVKDNQYTNMLFVFQIVVEAGSKSELVQVKARLPASGSVSIDELLNLGVVRTEGWFSWLSGITGSYYNKIFYALMFGLFASFMYTMCKVSGKKNKRSQSPRDSDSEDNASCKANYVRLPTKDMA